MRTSVLKKLISAPTPLGPGAGTPLPPSSSSYTPSINSRSRSLEFRKPVCGPNKEHRGSVPPRNVSQTIATENRIGKWLYSET
ncbi:hypothetical protein ARMSODRAFT_960508 [Armillaria solidipes]|uniref:Uncharacterized protein n=1 Tax=Armillaria solidipes TaxID=1076256 RepID=A0A2H3B581_9AGAR|nr:hypothetical protein ARMSODRAFT_960508 [Armillaria solidipes]